MASNKTSIVKGFDRTATGLKTAASALPSSTSWALMKTVRQVVPRWASCCRSCRSARPGISRSSTRQAREAGSAREINIDGQKLPVNPAPTITLKTQTPLTRREAMQAFDAVLALNGIAMINVGDKFVKAVPVAQANQEGAPFSKQSPDQLPEMGPYVTHVVQLKYARPTEMVQVLQPFAKIPNSILPIESSQIIVLRDYSENVKRMLEMIKEVDVSIPSEYVSEVIPIKYALSSDIANALNSLSSGGGGT